MPIFSLIAQKHGWILKGKPTPLSGGYMHKMYKLETDRGIFALKMLNPFIMQRETAMGNFAAAERIECLLEQQHIPILPARTFNGRKMQEINGQYYYVFDFYPGKPLKPDEITPAHCMKMGGVLARIHQTDQKTETPDTTEMTIDWTFCLNAMEQADATLHALLTQALPIIKRSQEKGNQARRKLPPLTAVCHNDMDCKNVLWSGDDYRIIDLECLSYNHPFMELFEMALCCAGYEHGSMDFASFRAFLLGYRQAGGSMPADWETLYDCNNGRLEWLEYNIKRVLGIDCGPDEKEMGAQQVTETVHQIIRYDHLREQLLAHCAAL